MANGYENLIPGNTPNGHKLTLEEQKAGGRASVEARRQKKSLKELVEIIAGSAVKNDQNRATLERAGLEPNEMTQAALIAHNIVYGSAQGDHRSISEFLDITGQRITRNINENHNLEYKPLIDLTNRKTVLEKKKNAGKKA